MKHKNQKLILLLSIFFTLVFFQYNDIDMNQLPDISRSEQWSSPSFKSSTIPTLSIGYLNHSTITINSNNDFLSIATSEGWSGDGNETTPVQITGLNIVAGSSTNLISIRNTDIHFQISDNLLSGGLVGISLDNVTHAHIENNQITGTSDAGLFFSYANNCTILNNFISNSGEEGIWLDHSMYPTIKDNTVVTTGSDGISLHTSSGNGQMSGNNVTFAGHYGFYISESANSRITKNYVYASAYAGIEIGYSANGIISNNTVIRNRFAHSIAASNSPGTTISFNTIFGHDTQGITVRDSPHSTVFRNTVEDDYYGILLNFSENSTVYENSLSNNSFGVIVDHTSAGISVFLNKISNSRVGGITIQNTAGPTTFMHNLITNCIEFPLFISSSSNNTVVQNDFIDNNIGETSQGYDNGNTGLANNVTHNYWNDRISPDTNTDGIVDTPYSFIGNSNNADPFPLTSPVHYLTPISILFPNGGETLNGTITTQWTASTDSLGLDVSYLLFYSADGGLTWHQIVSGLVSTSYIVDSTNVSDGSRYLIKVVAISSSIKGLTTEDISDAIFSIKNILSTTETSSSKTGEGANWLSLFEFGLILVIIIQIKRWKKKGIY